MKLPLEGRTSKTLFIRYLSIGNIVINPHLLNCIKSGMAIAKLNWDTTQNLATCNRLTTLNPIYLDQLKTRHIAKSLMISHMLCKAFCNVVLKSAIKIEKGIKTDSVLWQKLLHQQKISKSRVTTQNATKTSITQQLQTVLRRSVEAPTATQLVCLNRLTGDQSSYLPQMISNQKDTHLEIR